MRGNQKRDIGYRIAWVVALAVLVGLVGVDVMRGGGEAPAEAVAPLGDTAASTGGEISTAAADAPDGGGSTAAVGEGESSSLAVVGEGGAAAGAVMTTEPAAEVVSGIAPLAQTERSAGEGMESSLGVPLDGVPTAIPPPKVVDGGAGPQRSSALGRPWWPPVHPLYPTHPAWGPTMDYAPPPGGGWVPPRPPPVYGW